MPNDEKLVTAGRLWIAVGVALLVAATAAAAALLTPFWIEDGGQASRLGALNLGGSDTDLSGPLARAAEFYGSLSRLDSDPHHLQAAAEAYFRLGELQESSEPDRALDSYRKCVEYLGGYNHGWPWFKMGVILASKGEDERADEHFVKTMQIDDGALALLAGYERGEILLRAGRPEHAWDFFYEFLRFYPRSILQSQFETMSGNGAQPVRRGFYVAGRCHLALGETEQARWYLRQYLDLFPNDLSGRFYASEAGLEVEMPRPEDLGLLETRPHLSTGVQRREGAVAFETTGRIMIDVYVPNQPSAYSLRVLATKPTNELDVPLDVLVNAEHVGRIELMSPADIQSRLDAFSIVQSLPLRKGHNVLELALPYAPREEGLPESLLRIHAVFLAAEGAS